MKKILHDPIILLCGGYKLGYKGRRLDRIKHEMLVLLGDISLNRAIRGKSPSFYRKFTKNVSLVEGEYVVTEKQLEVISKFVIGKEMAVW